MSENVGSVKRQRLNYACNRCRRRKTRCDAGFPNCSSCSSAGVACITTDPRRDHRTVQRARTGAQENTVDAPPPGSPSRPSPTRALRGQDVTWTATHDSDHGEQRISGPEKARLLAFPRLRRGDNQLALTHWLDLAFKRLGVPMQLTPRSHLPRPFSGLPTENDIPNLCRVFDIFSREEYCLKYCNGINQIFPLFTAETVSNVMRHMPSQTAVASLDAVTASLVASSVIWSSQKEDTGISRACLGFALANINLVLMSGDLRAVQICILMALNLRARSDIGAAASIISLGSAIAHNLGINRAGSLTGSAPDCSDTDRESWCWWSLYCVEKIICLERERPSVIQDFDCNQTIPRHQGANASDHDQLWQGLITLCQLQSDIVEQLSKSRSAEEQPLSDWNEAKRDKVKMCVEIDSQLLRWAGLQSFNVTSPDASSFSQELTPMFSFLATQYYQSLFIVHRNLLVLNPRLIEQEAARWTPANQSRFRVARGGKICTDVARAVVGIADDIHSGANLNVAFSEYVLLMAIYTFAITALRNSFPGMVGSDLQLQARAIELALNYRRHFDEPSRSNHTAFLWELHVRVAARAPKRVSPPVEKDARHFARPSSAPQQPQEYLLRETPCLSNYNLEDDTSATSLERSASWFEIDHALPSDSASSVDILDWEALAFTYDLPRG